MDTEHNRSWDQDKQEHNTFMIAACVQMEEGRKLLFWKVDSGQPFSLIIFFTMAWIRYGKINQHQKNT